MKISAVLCISLMLFFLIHFLDFQMKHLSNGVLIVMLKIIHSDPINSAKYVKGEINARRATSGEVPTESASPSRC